MAEAESQEDSDYDSQEDSYYDMSMSQFLRIRHPQDAKLIKKALGYDGFQGFCECIERMQGLTKSGDLKLSKLFDAFERQGEVVFKGMRRPPADCLARFEGKLEAVVVAWAPSAGNEIYDVVSQLHPEVLQLQQLEEELSSTQKRLEELQEQKSHAEQKIDESLVRMAVDLREAILRSGSKSDERGGDIKDQRETLRSILKSSFQSELPEAWWTQEEDDDEEEDCEMDDAQHHHEEAKNGGKKEEEDEMRIPFHHLPRPLAKKLEGEFKQKMDVTPGFLFGKLSSAPLYR